MAHQPDSVSDEFVNHYLPERTIAQLQADLQNGTVTSRQLVLGYIERIEQIDRSGPTLRSVIELNPDALAMAEQLDEERSRSGPRGILHGIPVLIKDNIDTDDRMLSTAGSLALTTSQPAQEATVARQLREAGVIFLGKTNLSEWANFRSSNSISGWSGRGGQTRNANKLDCNPSGSSSGSGAAAAASLAAATLGTETDGSIVSPSNVNGIVGLKPTVGLSSRAGVVPISHSQDTVGPMVRCVADAAALLGTLTGVDPRDPATAASAGKTLHHYTQFLDPKGLVGARIGVARQVYTGYHAETDALFEQALQTLRHAGAEIIDPADLATAQEMKSRDGELKVMLYEFKRDLAAYLATRVASPAHPDAIIPRTLAELITFNNEHRDQEMPLFGQELFERSEALDLSEADYLQILADNCRLAGQEGIDATLERYQLDAIVAPTGAPAWQIGPKPLDKYLGGCASPAAMAGYPLITVPMGYVDVRPVGLTFMASAWSEPTLIRLAFAYEQASKLRRPPSYLP
ncbi:MAG: amidase [Caldilineaceae bacterium]